MKARIMTSLAGAAGCSAVMLSAVIVWLWLTQPLILVDAIGEGRATSLAAAVLRLLAAAFGSLVRYL